MLLPCCFCNLVATQHVPARIAVFRIVLKVKSALESSPRGIHHILRAQAENRFWGFGIRIENRSWGFALIFAVSIDSEYAGPPKLEHSTATDVSRPVNVPCPYHRANIASSSSIYRLLASCTDSCTILVDYIPSLLLLHRTSCIFQSISTSNIRSSKRGIRSPD